MTSKVKNQRQNFNIFDQNLLKDHRLGPHKYLRK